MIGAEPYRAPSIDASATIRAFAANGNRGLCTGPRLCLSRLIVPITRTCTASLVFCRGSADHFLPDAPLNLATLKIIFPYSATLAVVGLLESMMMASIIDDLLTPQAIRIGNASAKALPISSPAFSAEWRVTP